MTTKITLFDFWQDKQKEWGRRVSVSEVSRSIGVNRNTITAYLEGKVDRPDLRAIDKICRYFEVPPGPVPFLVYTED